MTALVSADKRFDVNVSSTDSMFALRIASEIFSELNWTTLPVRLRILLIAAFAALLCIFLLLYMTNDL